MNWRRCINDKCAKISLTNSLASLCFCELGVCWCDCVCVWGVGYRLQWWGSWGVWLQLGGKCFVPLYLSLLTCLTRSPHVCSVVLYFIGSEKSLIYQDTFLMSHFYLRAFGALLFSSFNYQSNTFLATCICSYLRRRIDECSLVAELHGNMLHGTNV